MQYLIKKIGDEFLKLACAKIYEISNTHIFFVLKEISKKDVKITIHTIVCNGVFIFIL